MLGPVVTFQCNLAHGAQRFFWCRVSVKWQMPAVAEQPQGTREVSVSGWSVRRRCGGSSCHSPCVPPSPGDLRPQPFTQTIQQPRRLGSVTRCRVSPERRLGTVPALKGQRNEMLWRRKERVRSEMFSLYIFKTSKLHVLLVLQT